MILLLLTLPAIVYGSTPENCVGCPWKVTTLSDYHKEIVDWSIKQLRPRCGVKEIVDKEILDFSQQTVSGTNYIFTVKLKYSDSCVGPRFNTCNIMVNERPWMNTRRLVKRQCEVRP